MGSNIYLTKTKRHIEMKPTQLGAELHKYFVVCGRSNVTPTMATRSTTVNMAVKWRLNPRKRIEFAYGRSSWNLIRKLAEQRSQNLWNGTRAHKTLSGVLLLLLLCRCCVL
jgi:hypothetical protein